LEGSDRQRQPHGANLTGQVRNIAEVATAIAKGDLSANYRGCPREILQLKETMNTMVDQLRSFAAEVTRVAREVGTEGKLAGRAVVPGVAGTWKDLTDNVNLMAANLTGQVRNIAEVTDGRGARRPFPQDCRRREGRNPRAQGTINTMVDQLNAFAPKSRAWRARSARRQAGRQALGARRGRHLEGSHRLGQRHGANLTDQVRGIVKVVTGRRQR
jgi:HAMP domain-containing protein